MERAVVRPGLDERKCCRGEVNNAIRSDVGVSIAGDDHRLPDINQHAIIIRPHHPPLPNLTRNLFLSLGNSIAKCQNQNGSLNTWSGLEPSSHRQSEGNFWKRTMDSLGKTFSATTSPSIVETDGCCMTTTLWALLAGGRSRWCAGEFTTVRNSRGNQTLSNCASPPCSTVTQQPLSSGTNLITFLQFLIKTL